MFTFKQFQIDDTGCGMPVSTDGILLGAWTEVPDNGHLLDIGCGSGLLSLMLAQRYKALNIYSLDIDHKAIQATKKNVANSLWAERISIVQDDILNWAYRQESASFSSIVCNPPYFTSGRLARNQSRAIARHTEHLDFSSLMQVTSYLLNEEGLASFILPFKEAQQCIAFAKEQMLFLQRVCEVKATDRKPVSRLLFTLGKQSVDSVSVQELTIRTNGKYTDEYVFITRDFYLKM